jgi:hypothetical protein
MKTSAVLASGLMVASMGLAACSSSSSSSSGSSAAASATGEAAATTDAGPSDAGTVAPDPSGAVSGGTDVTATIACDRINAISTEYMAGFTTTDDTLWGQFADETLSLSSDATDPDLSAALMSLAVAAQFTVTGLESGEDLTTSKGDFDTALNDVGTLCTAAGVPLK